MNLEERYAAGSELAFAAAFAKLFLAFEHTAYRLETRERAADLPKYDYWLFDSRKLLKMRFTDDDQFLGGEIIEDPADN